MHVRSLKLINFKNYKKADLSFSPSINCIVGPNGAGKTNLLDALYYICYTKSAINSFDQNNIHHNQDFFNITAEIEARGISHSITCIFQSAKGKIFRVDNHEYEKLSEHIGRFPSVLIQPTDTDLIREGSILRRKFFDLLISQLNTEYLRKLINYSRALNQRNRTLKHFAKSSTMDKDLIASYDRTLIGDGLSLYNSRDEFINRFLPVFQKQYSFIAGNSEKVGINYISQCSNDNFTTLFKKCLNEDLRVERTTMGIHKDNYEFLLEGYPLKREGSQGQQKSFIIALKIAMFRMLSDNKGFRPLLLLDDIFDKLDQSRVQQLLRLIDENQLGQIFITDARSDRIRSLMNNLKAETVIFELSNGQLKAATPV